MNIEDKIQLAAEGFSDRFPTTYYKGILINQEDYRYMLDKYNSGVFDVKYARNPETGQIIFCGIPIFHSAYIPKDEVIVF